MYNWNSSDLCTLTVLNDSIKLHRGSLPIFAANLIEFNETVTGIYNLEHFYILMNNSGLIHFCLKISPARQYTRFLSGYLTKYPSFALSDIFSGIPQINSGFFCLFQIIFHFTANFCYFHRQDNLFVCFKDFPCMKAFPQFFWLRTGCIGFRFLEEDLQFIPVLSVIHD